MGNPHENEQSSKDGKSREDTSFDRQQAIRASTDPETTDLIVDIVGHPAQMPTIEELDYMNPEKTTESIQNHLSTLIAHGVVKAHELPSEELQEDYPDEAYGLTFDAEVLFDYLNLFPEDALNRQYSSVRKPPRIEEIEAIPRPDRDR